MSGMGWIGTWWTLPKSKDAVAPAGSVHEEHVEPAESDAPGHAEPATAATSTAAPSFQVETRRRRIPARPPQAEAAPIVNWWERPVRRTPPAP